MNPKFCALSRITMPNDIRMLYEVEKKNLIKVLQPYWTSITTDSYTSIQNIKYMVVTAHWINDEWELQRRIISFFSSP